MMSSREQAAAPTPETVDIGDGVARTQLPASFFDRDPDDPVEVDELLMTFERFDEYQMLAVHYIWEDLFWRRKHEPVAWLEKLIRL